MLEKPHKLDAQKRSSMLEAAAFGAALLGVIDSAPAKALDIPPETSWAQGIDALRHAALNDQRETAIAYIKFSDSNGVWPRAKIISAALTAAQYSPESELKYMQEKWRGAHVEARCFIHTHPHAYKVPGPMGKTYSLPHIPPSDGDVLTFPGVEKSVDNIYRILKIPIERYEGAVADAKGLTYYRLEKNPRTPNVESWRKAYTKFLTKSVFDKNFQFDIEYKELQIAYKDHLGADIRFVSYEDAKNEPPCAGVDFKPAYNVSVTLNQDNPRSTRLDRPLQ